MSHVPISPLIKTTYSHSISILSFKSFRNKPKQKKNVIEAIITTRRQRINRPEMAKEGLGFEITELRLGLPGDNRPSSLDKNEKKRCFSEIASADDENSSSTGDRKNQNNSTQIVGWPPVCSYRKKSNAAQVETSKLYVKVSMDGAPFLRKIDLKTQKGYSDLSAAFEELFRCYGIGGMWKDSDSSEYIPIYEDKDGDWMLVGDVPWEMFTESCKRLRIMKRSDAKGFGLQQSKPVVNGETQTDLKI